MNQPSIKQLHLSALNSLQRTPTARPGQASPAASPSPRVSSTPKASSTPRTTKTVSIQHMSTQKAKTNQRLLYDVINWLRDTDKPATAEEIHAATGYDIKATPGMMEALQSNVKIAYEDGWFSYKPPYSVKNIHELRELIHKTPDGIEVSELKDCYKTVDEDIKKLLEDHDVLVVQNADTKSDNVYPNDIRYRISVADDFKKAWLSITVPDAVDLEREMRAAGLKLAEEEEEKTARKLPSKKDKKAQKKRIIKYTNTHMLGTGIDITKDYVKPEEKQ